MVQYFERSRFELHADTAPPFDVLLGRLGVQSLAARGADTPHGQASDPLPGCTFFPGTQQNLCAPFAAVWEQQGGLARIGLPLTPAQPLRSATDGQLYLTQYFERARFELHPDQPAQVQLGLLGSELFAAHVTPVALHAAAVQRLLALINGARQERGAPLVALAPQLMGVAGTYSMVEAAEGQVSHTGPDGSRPEDRLRQGDYAWSAYAENLALGYADADVVFAAWMASPAHRANILTPLVRAVGIGWTQRAWGTEQVVDAWVLELAAPQ